MAKDEVQERHVGTAFAFTENGVNEVQTEPHYKHECCEAQHRAMTDFEARLDPSAPETVYEGASAGATSVGYSKRYAERYDSVFGKN